eukprot:m.110994 g.110994  ORF g.110994 m.110994 type:complete len:422 (+) comp10738_c0_seq1:493-1758(+)
MSTMTNEAIPDTRNPTQSPARTTSPHPGDANPNQTSEPRQGPSLSVPPPAQPTASSPLLRGRGRTHGRRGGRLGRSHSLGEGHSRWRSGGAGGGEGGRGGRSSNHAAVPQQCMYPMPPVMASYEGYLVYPQPMHPSTAGMYAAQQGAAGYAVEYGAAHTMMGPQAADMYGMRMYGNPMMHMAQPYMVPYAGQRGGSKLRGRHHTEPVMSTPSFSDCHTVAECDVMLAELEAQRKLHSGVANKRRRQKLNAKMARISEIRSHLLDEAATGVAQEQTEETPIDDVTPSTESGHATPTTPTAGSSKMNRYDSDLNAEAVPFVPVVAADSEPCHVEGKDVDKVVPPHAQDKSRKASQPTRPRQSTRVAVDKENSSKSKSGSRSANTLSPANGCACPRKSTSKHDASKTQIADTNANTGGVPLAPR